MLMLERQSMIRFCMQLKGNISLKRKHESGKFMLPDRCGVYLGGFLLSLPRFLSESLDPLRWWLGS
jgi:hypothetical protein